MRHLLRTLLLGLLLPALTQVLAQPYPVTITGHIIPCSPAIAAGNVHVQSQPGTLPVIDELVPLNSNCYYTLTVLMDDTAGGFTVSASCANGITSINSGWYGVDILIGSATLTLDIDCGAPPPPDCEACFTVTQASGGGMLTPFTANFTNCSSGGNAPYTYNWSMPDGSVSGQVNETFVFPGEGVYGVCLTITDVDACTSVQCDTVYVDVNGVISITPPDCPPDFAVSFTTSVSGNTVSFNATSNQPNTSFYWNLGDGSGGWGPQPFPHTYADGGPYTVCLNAWTWNGVDTCFAQPYCLNVGPFGGGVPDCLQIPDGPNQPGTPCESPATGPGIWNNDCECIPNTILPCQAGFWVIQAYTVDSMAGGVTVVEPIPFELWIWNLSSGGTGNFEFLWDFGDGNSSTDAFPTHVYGGSGPYTLCLTITDDAGCTSTYCEDIEVDQDGILGLSTGPDVRSNLVINVIQDSLPTGIHEQNALRATSLWPNPAVDQFNLSLNSSRSGTLELSIIDLNGRQVRHSSVAVQAGANQLPVDVNGLQPGMYMLRLMNGNNSATLRFVKQ
jgi:PKD repeat protein